MCKNIFSDGKIAKLVGYDLQQGVGRGLDLASDAPCREKDSVKILGGLVQKGGE